MPENFEDGVEYAGHHSSVNAWLPVVAKLLDSQWAVRYGRADTGEWVPAHANQRLVVSLFGERTAGGAGLVRGLCGAFLISVGTDTSERVSRSLVGRE